MSARVNAANRVVLTLLGLLLLAAGAAGLALSFGSFGAARSHASVLPPSLRAFAADTAWFWWAVLAGCVLLALLGLRWLLAQLRTDRVSRLDLTRDEADGITTVHAGAFTDAVAEEAAGIRGVSGASAHVNSHRGQRLALTVDLADYADIPEVRSRLEEVTVAHARQAVDDPDLPVDIQLRPGASRRGRGLA